MMRVRIAFRCVAGLAAMSVLLGVPAGTRGGWQEATAGRSLRVALVGASGNVGPRVLAELGSRGHTVTAIGRTPETIKAGPGVTAVKGDVNDAALAKTLAGHDAVISAVPFVNVDPDTLIGSIRASGVTRDIVVGSASSLVNAQGVRLIDTPPLSTMAEPRAGVRFFDHLRTVTDLDWTFLSPAILFTAGTRTGTFRLGTDQVVVDAEGRSRVSSGDDAVALVDELEKPAHTRRRFTIGY